MAAPPSMCMTHNFILNINKMKEMIFDPRAVQTHHQIVIDNKAIELVGLFYYPDIFIDKLLKWHVHVDYLCSKLAQRLPFLRRPRLSGLSSQIMTFLHVTL